ncbi:MAG TPA: sensor domain-containing diguanylate cyclase [Candidatus Limnocylindrales bacterium]
MARQLPAASHPGQAAADSLHRQILESLEEGVYLVDRDRRIEYWNTGAERISGYPADRVVGRRCFENILNHVDDAGRVLCHDGCPLAATIDDGEPREVRVFLRHRDGHRVPVRVRAAAIRDAAGTIIGAAEVFSDITPVRAAEQAADELRRLAFVDELTGLPNRRAIEHALAGRLASLTRHGWSFGLLVIDVDRFKHINDAYGHTVGDVALRTVARTIASASRSEDFVGRWGGDEFVVLVSAAAEPALEQAARRICALVARCRLEDTGGEIDLAVSVGFTVADPRDTPELLFERADRALYEAKIAGRSPSSAALSGDDVDAQPRADHRR